MKKKTHKENKAVEEYVRYLEYEIAGMEFKRERILGAVKVLEALHLITRERAEKLFLSVKDVGSGADPKHGTDL